MRRAFLMLFTCLVLVFTQAFAEVTLVMDTPSVSLGQTVYFHAAGMGDEVKYDLYTGGEMVLRTGFVTEHAGALIPSAAGNYLLKVTDRASGESAQASFTVTGRLTVRLSGEEGTVTAGDAAEYTASAEGGTLPYTYTFSVDADNERFYGRSGSEDTFSYTTVEAGEYTVNCTVTDAQGARATASAKLQVKEGPGISAECDEAGPFRLYGGVRTYTVHSPGIWTAETDADFISLSAFSGADGSQLTVSVLPGSDRAERGTVVLRSGKKECEIIITRLADDGVEKEVSLLGAGSFLNVDGERMAVWEDAQGQREFAVTSDCDWIAVPSDPWIRAEYGADGGLSVSVEESDASARAGYILLENDRAETAYISIYQCRAGDAPAVTALTLSSHVGISYEDRITAWLKVEGEADRITVYRMGSSFPVAEAGRESCLADGTWAVSFPVEGSGEETYLFAPYRGDVMGGMMTASVNAFGEQAAFSDLYADAERDGDVCTVQVRITSSVQSILLLDGDGREMGMIRAEDALIDRYIDEENRGQFSAWTFTVPAGGIPARLRVGMQTLDVVVRDRVYPELIFDQFDGTWDTVKYRHSDLEASGCAIFALSSALRKLGFVTDDALPAALAEDYAFCLVEGGTLNSTLVGNAAKNFGFRTRYDLYTDRESVEALFAQGALFSFSVVKGHIALADAISEDGSMIHVVDSALTATFSRLKDESVYIMDEGGTFIPVAEPSSVPGARYFIETEAYSGGEYWLETDYVVGRGVRLIMKKE